MQAFLASLRIVVVSMIVCVVIHATAILGLAQGLVPHAANGSLVTGARGEIIGSELIAQKFERPGYLWPRPSAVDYNAAGAGGSNASPASAILAARANAIVTAYGATADHPLPAELAAASGAGLDPHVTLAAALYQAPRIARARNAPQAEIEALMRAHARAFADIMNTTAEARLVNVLALNRALDEAVPSHPPLR